LANWAEQFIKLMRKTADDEEQNVLFLFYYDDIIDVC